MEVNAQLTPEGEYAYRCAAESVDAERYPHAVLRFARAVDLEERLRAEWVDLGRPMLVDAPNGTPYAHPLLKLIREAAADTSAAARTVLLDPEKAKPRSKGGRPMGSASAPDRTGTTEPAKIRLARRSTALGELEQLYAQSLGYDLTPGEAQRALVWAEENKRPPMFTPSDPDGHYGAMYQRYLDGAELSEDVMHGLSLWRIRAANGSAAL